MRQRRPRDSPWSLLGGSLMLLVLLVREADAFGARSLRLARLSSPWSSSSSSSSSSSPSPSWLSFAKPIKVSEWAEGAGDGTVIKDGAVTSKAELAEAAAAAATAQAKSAPKAQKMELFVKAGPEGTDVGDCPFAHYDRMVLAAKGLSYTTTPCTAETKPDWLVDSYEGKMPCLLHDGEARCESEDIALYLNFFFPSPELRASNDATDAATAGFFPALAKFLKNKDDGEDVALLAGLEERLSALDAHLATVSSSPDAPLFMAGGDAIGLVDCSLAPKLFHMAVAAGHYKGGFAVDAGKHPALARYMAGIFEHPAFKETTVPDETVIWGWGNARQ